jgi:hypothetical protein
MLHCADDCHLSLLLRHPNKSFLEGGNTVGFKDKVKGLQAKKFGQPLEAEKGKETDSHPEPLEGTRPTNRFWSNESHVRLFLFLFFFFF